MSILSQLMLGSWLHVVSALMTPAHETLTHDLSSPTPDTLNTYNVDWRHTKVMEFLKFLLKNFLACSVVCLCKLCQPFISVDKSLQVKMLDHIKYVLVVKPSLKLPFDLGIFPFV